MSKIKKAAVLAVSIAALGFPMSAVPAAAATNGALGCEENWSLWASEGYANGCYEYNYVNVTGTAYDTNADGRCPFVRAHMWDGRVRDSNWATGKGTKVAVNIIAPPGTTVRYLTWEYIRC